MAIKTPKVPLGGFILATFLYALAAWFIFNAVFALGMYFRPTRKPPSTAVAGAVGEPRDGRSVTLSKILFFGFWLNDRHHSA
jgi:hypothetical protein